ncbi:TolC family protein [Achromobacter ruhlandii]|uniref:TolC family protein n=3 Tax=Achromobacter ruhlandii TaxID=72557 RepID=UPI003BA050F5
MEQLTLMQAIERSLCHDPALRQAWGAIPLRRAQIGQRRAAYFPRLDGQASQSWVRNTLDQSDERQTIRTRHRSQSAALNLSWVLFDSGRREAALDEAAHLLSAAYADHNAAMQRAFLDVAQLYFSMQAAHRRLTAAEQVVTLAHANFVAASERHRAGAAALADRLQAQTAYTQANLRRARERGALASAQGALALRMGLAAGAPLSIEVNEVPLAAQTFVAHVDELIAIARQRHPVLVAARARMAAAQAAIAGTRAAARPTLALTGGLTQSRRSTSEGQAPGSRTREGAIGLQLSIPIFRGFEHTYQVREAEAQAAISAAELSAQQQRIATEVWTQHAALKMETENLGYTRQLIDQSARSLEIMQGRYQAGVGTMTDVLNAMSAYASAREQHIEATRSWQVSRLNLAGSLGRLGFWEVEGADD